MSTFKNENDELICELQYLQFSGKNYRTKHEISRLIKNDNKKEKQRKGHGRGNGRSGWR